jgi:hypothetical protein
MAGIRDTKIFKWWEQYEHHFGLGALLLGSGFDLFMANRPDSLANNLLLLSYLTIAGGLIVVLNLREMQRARGKHESEPFFLLLVLQFCFGGLASNLLVLYGKSGTFASSAIFFGLLIALILGNEFMRNRYALLRLNVGIYYFLLLTYLTLAVPIYLTHSVGVWVFVLSGVISLVLIGLFLFALYVAVFRRNIDNLRGVSLVVGGVFVLFNMLYFANIIPPVPLSLKDIGVYHSILKQGSGNYIALYEPSPWWQVWRNTSATYTLAGGSTAMCFSSVFAPTDLNAPIYHRWEKKDSSTGQWMTVSRVAFGISGGREDGYRGYSLTSALSPGSWRCDVETAQGQLIGREDFMVIQGGAAPQLSQKTL